MLLEEDVVLPPGTDDGAGRIGSEDLIRPEEAEEFADGGEFADPGDAGQLLAGEEMHEAVHIRAAHPLWVVEVHPDGLHPGDKLPQVVAIGPDGIGREILLAFVITGRSWQGGACLTCSCSICRGERRSGYGERRPSVRIY